jgi:hypothetical protein
MTMRLFLTSTLTVAVASAHAAEVTQAEIDEIQARSFRAAVAVFNDLGYNFGAQEKCGEIVNTLGLSWIIAGFEEAERTPLFESFELGRRRAKEQLSAMPSKAFCAETADAMRKSVSSIMQIFQMRKRR